MATPNATKIEARSNIFYYYFVSEIIAQIQKEEMPRESLKLW